jgi:uncharacterized protein with FMN-binding domain
MIQKRSLVALCIALVLVAVSGCETETVLKVRRLPIRHVDLGTVKDGSYPGEYAYGNFTYGVEVAVSDHRITDISVTKNRKTSHAKMAEEVLGKVIDEQRNDVDAIAGATTTSKALLKAVETALDMGADPAAD